MSEWFPATVAEAARGRSSLVQLALNVPHELASVFRTPGQYHRVGLDRDDNPYAIASAPGHARFEYLVRRAPGLAERWAALEPGDEVRVSLPHGPGFPLGLARGHSLVLVATGAGFAPIRSALELVAEQRAAFKSVRAVVGVHAPDDLAWDADLPRWARRDIIVHQVVSTPDARWSGRVGHVQDHLEALAPAEDDAVAFLCGQPEMVAEVGAELGRRGVPPGRVFLNLPR